MVTYGNVRSLLLHPDGLSIATRTGRPFLLAIEGDRLVFTPESTRLPRASTSRHEFEAIASAIARTGDRRTSAYTRRSGNASYVLALIERCERELANTGEQAETTL